MTKGLHILVMIPNAAVGVAQLSGDCYKNLIIIIVIIIIIACPM